jgi:peptidoglycan/LPS O-acetylase OafA/YrhL
LERWKSATSFLVARAVRIYPALIACVVVTVLLCAAATTVDLTDYFLSRDTVKYLAYNSTMLRGFVVFELPGVFTSNPVPKVVNGSLWTLPIEAMAYVLFAVSMSAVRFKREMPVFLLTVGIVGLVVSNKMYSSADIQVVFAKFWLAFLAGASIASLLDRGLLVAVIHISAVAAILFLLQCAMLALLLLLVAATVAIGSISIPARYALPLDISYGFYLYA